jgi:hypothetical protein
MVAALPLANFPRLGCRWQTVFAVTTPLAGERAQNTVWRDIQATVSGKPPNLGIVPRLFRNIEQCIRIGRPQPNEPL